MLHAPRLPPLIVFENADIEDTANGAITYMFRGSRQPIFSIFAYHHSSDRHHHLRVGYLHKCQTKDLFYWTFKSLTFQRGTDDTIL